MSVTVIKYGSVLRLVEVSEQIPAGTRLVLYTAPELKNAMLPNAMEAPQLDSVFSEDDEDWGDRLEELLKERPKSTATIRHTRARL